MWRDPAEGDGFREEDSPDPKTLKETTIKWPANRPNGVGGVDWIEEPAIEYQTIGETAPVEGMGI